MSQHSKNLRSIAFYLPQYHPIPENDLWWGKGFTEWTNVGKAKPLYQGHYQPHVPADFGYYDLRMKEIRSEQAAMARLYGLNGFCYWHYWFGHGDSLLERPFNEVLNSGEPDFPFCLGWANHSWEAKNWSTSKQKNKILKKQEYPGYDDCVAHFDYIKKAFSDIRYIKINGRPVFVIWDPLAIPSDFDYIKKWRALAEESGLSGVYFIGFTFFKDRINDIYERGYDNVLYDGLFDARNSDIAPLLFIKKAIREIFGYPIRLNYSKYERANLDVLLTQKVLPCIMPNYDHTPRSGKRGLVLESTPKLFEKFLTKVVLNIQNKKISAPFIFIKSWNEWGEGNHLEPDLKFGHKFLEALKNGLGFRSN
jgi:hypothetical protein